MLNEVNFDTGRKIPVPGIVYLTGDARIYEK
jgi:hypothetical protein